MEKGRKIVVFKRVNQLYNTVVFFKEVQRAQNGAVTCFVAEQEGRLTGAIMTGHDGRRGYIYHTCVRRENRRAGLGRAVVETALAALRAEDIHKVALVAFARNTDGNAFWERMGFTVREDLMYRDHSLTELVRIDP